ncbi:MAG: hypothetical protein K8R99_04330 [Actinomycetia bacterium]|nr:hypothetical protein [Actinomycetes bacterium]
MTEIPEHLLKRSKERRGAAGETPGTAVATTTPTTPAAAGAAVEPAGKAVRTESAAPVGPPPAQPDSPVVAAYKARKKIPVWAMLTLSILPVWAFMYVRALQPETVVATGPLGEGATVYNQCASCHGGSGEGGVGYSFQAGSVIATFPHIEDQLRWVKFGSEAYVAAGVTIAGDPNRAGGAHIAGATGVMPAAAAALGLSDVEILAVVCHERFDLAGVAHEGTEYDTWCSPTSAIFLALEAGTATFANVHEQFEGVLQIGEAPLAGASANG